MVMAPMPERDAVNHGDYLSHLHFQYGDSVEALIKEGRLTNPMWYATMCVADADMTDKYNIVRGLHKLPKWSK